MAEAKKVASAPAKSSPRSSELSISTFAAFRDRRFTLLWVSTFTFMLTQGIQRFAFVWLAIELSESSGALGLVSFALGIPVLFVSMPAGMLSDRIDRRLLLFDSQIFILAVSTLSVILIWSGAISLPLVLVIALMVGLGAGFGMPVRQSIVPSLVPPERLMNAITLMSLGQNTSMMVGPAIGGGAIAIWGIGGGFAVQAILLGVGLIPLFFLRVPPPEGATQHRAGEGREALAGLSFVFRAPGVRALFLLLFVTALCIIGPFQAIIPKIAEERLGSGALGASLLYTSFGVGMIISSLFLASVPNIPNAGGWFTGTVLFPV